MPPSFHLLAFTPANPMLLWWLAAAGAPLVIHLLNRRKYREVPWAAMQYLLAAIRKNSRRIQVEQLILLLIRMLIIALLVMAVAEFYTQFLGRKFVSGRRTHKVLVLDGSFSMGYKPTDRSRFDRAKELAGQIVQGSSQGDAFTLVLLGSPPRKLVATPVFERDALLKELENLALPHGTADLPATLEAVEDVLQTARRDQPRLEQEEVYFLTDLGRVGWLPDLRGPAETAAFRERAQRLAEQTALSVIDVGQSGADNLALESLRVADSFASLAREVTLEAEAVNLGRQPRLHQLIEYFVDDRRAGEAFVDLPPGDRATAAFTYRFDTPGDHVVKAQIVGDLLEIDNNRWLSLAVRRSIRVLCINGKPAGDAFAGATDYLEVALAPKKDDGNPSLVLPEVKLESALQEIDLRSYDCVFLANVAQFTESEALVLQAYLKGGGGLVFFLGDQVQADSYNQRLGGAGGNSVRVLPAQIGPLVAEAQYLFDPLEYKHPIVAPFRGQERAGLLTTNVSKYFRLVLPEESKARVALAFAGGAGGGDPVIVEEQIGQGRAILVATSADVSWTTMPMWPSYVPIVQELVSAAISGQSDERNVTVGTSIGGALRGAGQNITIDILTPDGQTEPARAVNDGEGGRWSFSETFLSGPYAARLGSPFSSAELFAVNVDTAESDLAKLELDELKADVWPDIDFGYSTVWQDVDAEPSTDIARRGSLSRAFLYPVLLLLLLEPVLAWWFGRQQP
ncbi:MAG: BatA domain-containing protein [Pirellulales bacterium]